MELDLVSLKGSAMSSSMFWGLYRFGMALGSLSANGQGCVPVLLQVWCEGPGLDLACLGVGPGLSAEMDAFGRAHHLLLCDNLEGWGGAWEGASGG